MLLSRDDLIAELDAVIPDYSCGEQAERAFDDEGNELLAQFVANIALYLYDPGSTNAVNLQCIAANLEDASCRLATASRLLRRLGNRS